MTTSEYLISLPCGSSRTCHPHQLRPTVHCPPSSYHSPKRSVKMATCPLRTMLLSFLMTIIVLSRMTSALVVPLTANGDCPSHTVRTLDGNSCMSCSSCYSDYSPQDWLCMNCTQGGAPFLGDEQRLYQRLFLKKPYYNSQLRPLKNNSDQVVVQFTMKIKQIVDIDERNQIMKMNIIIQQRWKDHWLHWDPKDYGGLEELRVPAYDVWLPDTTLYDTQLAYIRALKPLNQDGGKTNSLESLARYWDDLSARSRVQYPGHPDDEDWIGVSVKKLQTQKMFRADTNSAYAGITGTNVVLNYNGMVKMKTKPYIQRSTCHIKIRFFPFDEQKCQLKFGLWTYDWNHVDLQNSTAGPDKSLYLQNEQWDLMYSCFKRNLESYICCPTKYVDVTLFVGIRRKPLYYMYKLVMPIVLLSALSMVGFLMPYNVGVVKANLSITLILSMTVFLLLVAETIPKTSEGLPLISEYYLSIMFLIAISTAMNITVLNIFHRGEDGSVEVPQWLRTLVLKYMARIMCMDCKGEYFLTRTNEPKIDQARLAMLRKQRWFNARYGTSYTPLIQDSSRVNNDGMQGGCSNGHNAQAELDHFVENLGESDNIRLTKMESNVYGILRQIRTVQKKADRSSRVHREWALVATVTDRLLFYIYACFTVAVSVIILLVNPSLDVHDGGVCSTSSSEAA